MVAALGVNQSRLFTGIFALGIFLAALGGALQIPRDAVTHQMDLSIIVEVFAVVIIGGLGSLAGAFLAAVLVAELNAFGILVFPGISMVMVFLAMAVVLVVRPHGLLGRPFAPDRAAAAATARPWRPFTARERLAVAAGIAAAAALPLVAGAYGLTVAAEVMIAVVFAASLQLLMSAGAWIPSATPPSSASAPMARPWRSSMSRRRWRSPCSPARCWRSPAPSPSAGSASASPACISPC